MSERQEIVDWASKIPVHDLSDGKGLCRVIFAEDFLRALKDLPSAQPERKKGEWVWLSSTYDRTPCEKRFWCSECHHETIMHSNGMSEPWEKFCPNCGAKMDGKETGDGVH